MRSWQKIAGATVTSLLVAGAAVWAAGGEWSARGERLTTVEAAQATHETTPGRHITIDAASGLEGRLSTIETQQGVLIGEVDELRGDVKEVLRRLPSGNRFQREIK